MIIWGYLGKCIKKYIDNNELNVKCFLTEPAEPNSEHGIQGINDGKDFLLDKSVIDGTIPIKTKDAISRMKKFWEDTGILVGISSGANILAAEKYLDMYDPETNVKTAAWLSYYDGWHHWNSSKHCWGRYG